MRYEIKDEGSEYMVYLYFTHHDGRNIVLSVRTEHRNIERAKTKLRERKGEEYDQHLSAQPPAGETSEIQS